MQIKPTCCRFVVIVGYFKRCSQLWLRLRCNCDVTATRNEHVYFSARSHGVAANHNAGIGMGVAILLDQLLWRHRCRFFTCLCGKRCKVMERRLTSKQVQSLIHKFRVEECLWNVTSPKYADADVRQAALQSISVAPDGIPTGTVTNHEFVESICICRRMSRDSVLLQ